MLKGTSAINSLLPLVLHILISNGFTGAEPLAAPRNVSMESVNMRHLLRWSGPRALCSALSYSVQFQGEWERLFKNGSWVEAIECQQIQHPECDLTSDLASDSDYSIRVRAECNGQASVWTPLQTTFNRRNTIIVMNMDVKVSGDAVQVNIGHQSLMMTVTLTMWERGDDFNRTVEVVGVDHLSHTFSGMRPGAAYCLRALAEVEGSHRIATTGIQCVSIPSSQGPWLIPVMVGCVLLGTMALSCLLGWAVKYRKKVVQHTWLHKVPLPSVLVDGWPATTPVLAAAAPEPLRGVLLLLPPLPHTDLGEP